MPLRQRWLINGQEHRHGAADHLRRHGHGAPANQVSAAFAQAKLHRAAIGVTQRAGVIAEQPGIAGAAGNADLLLDALLRHPLTAAHAAMVLQPLAELPRCLRL